MEFHIKKSKLNDFLVLESILEERVREGKKKKSL